MYQVTLLEDFVRSVFQKIDCPEEDCRTISDVLLAAELRGIPSHGLLRIKDYINLWKNGRIKTRPEISIVHETPGTAVIDGDQGMGMVVGKKAMNLAIEKAIQSGTGWVAVRNSNHYGIAGFYSMMALQHNMIGVSMTNANPLVAPTWSTDRLLGTNPIAVAIPAMHEPPLVADFATTPIARGKLDVMHKKGQSAPRGFVQDEFGHPSTDPNILTQGGAIVPLGGDYEHGSHKGYCLGSVVDIFSAILSGAGFGPFVPPSVAYLPMPDPGHGKGTGHFFGAIRIDAFQPADAFKNRMDEWIKTFRSANPANGHEKVLIPGDPERENEQKYRNEGITLLEKVKENLAEVCSMLEIEFPL